MINKTHHHFALNVNPWPLLVSLNAFTLLISILVLVKIGEGFAMGINILNISVGSFIWWLSYSDEFSMEGKETLSLESGLKCSMILFISSEVFFFFSFFWSYFHYYMAPTMETGMVWPPVSLITFDCLNVPLVNTLLLLSSGITVTISHYFIIGGNFKNSMKALVATVVLGWIFTSLQCLEYSSSFFSLTDSTFGSSFFMLTGFHGLHVVIGTLFLMTVLTRALNTEPSKKEFLSFEMASWYWHFVDVVWVFLFFLIYYLNS